MSLARLFKTISIDYLNWYLFVYINKQGASTSPLSEGLCEGVVLAFRPPATAAQLLFIVRIYCFVQ
jgi:hypothetical protein